MLAFLTQIPRALLFCLISVKLSPIISNILSLYSLCLAYLFSLRLVWLRLACPLRDPLAWWLPIPPRLHCACVLMGQIYVVQKVFFSLLLADISSLGSFLSSHPTQNLIICALQLPIRETHNGFSKINEGD